MATRTKVKGPGEAGEVAGGLLEVTQVRSAIGTKPKHRGTLRALGLRGVGQSNRLPDRPEIRGMIRLVDHLVAVRPAPAQAGTENAARSGGHAAERDGDDGEEER